MPLIVRRALILVSIPAICYYQQIIIVPIFLVIFGYLMSIFIEKVAMKDTYYRSRKDNELAPIISISNACRDLVIKIWGRRE